MQKNAREEISLERELAERGLAQRHCSSACRTNVLENLSETVVVATTALVFLLFAFSLPSQLRQTLERKEPWLRVGVNT